MSFNDNLSLSQRDMNVLWHPFTQMATAHLPIAIVKGKGTKVYDENGNAYIDGVASWWMNLHGHSHPYLCEKLIEQAQTLEHVIFANFTHAPAVNLAEGLLKVLPNNQARVFLSDNGSTAVEVGVKMALQYWYNKGFRHKKRIIGLQDAYHGDTFGAMSVGGRSIFNKPFEPFLFEASWLSKPNKNSLAEIQALYDKYGEEIAAFVFEPLVQGAGGMLMHNPEDLDAILGFCKEKNIICIADEVMTGFYRTGKFFATDWCQHKPDIFCLSKGITAGMFPLGATTCTAEIFDAFKSSDNIYKTFFHGHSHAGNPLACALGVANLELLLNDTTQANIECIIESHKKFIAEELAHVTTAKNIRQTGVILAFDWCLFDDNETSYAHAYSGFIWKFFIEKGLILRPLGNTIYILPPYCINEEELSILYKGIMAFLSLKKEDLQSFVEEQKTKTLSSDIFI